MTHYAISGQEKPESFAEDDSMPDNIEDLVQMLAKANDDVFRAVNRRHDIENKLAVFFAKKQEYMEGLNREYTEFFSSPSPVRY